MTQTPTGFSLPSKVTNGDKLVTGILDQQLEQVLEDPEVPKADPECVVRFHTLLLTLLTHRNNIGVIKDITNNICINTKTRKSTALRAAFS